MITLRLTTAINLIAMTVLAATVIACSEPHSQTTPQTTTNTQANIQAEPQPITIRSIYWSDGDSGRLNGSLKFRLNDIDAPETGGVGAAIGGAKCEAERAKGYESKAWAVNFTKDKPLKITNTHGQDRYERLIIDLSSNERDVGQSGIQAGHYQSWPHDGKKSLAPRPIWCP